jgi:hypothetical protein
MVFSRINKLKGFSYINGNLWMSIFHCNWNRNKFFFVAQVMTKTISKSQTDRFESFYNI